MISSIYLPFLAEAQPAATSGLFDGPMSPVVMLLMFAGFWFLIIAPQRKRQKSQEKMIAALAVGDEVIMLSGMYGTIAQLKEDRVVLKVAEGVKVEFSRNAVQSRLNAEKSPK